MESVNCGCIICSILLPHSQTLIHFLTALFKSMSRTLSFFFLVVNHHQAIYPRKLSFSSSLAMSLLCKLYCKWTLDYFLVVLSSLCASPEKCPFFPYHRWCHWARARARLSTVLSTFGSRKSVNFKLWLATMMMMMMMVVQCRWRNALFACEQSWAHLETFWCTLLFSCSFFSSHSLFCTWRHRARPRKTR